MGRYLAILCLLACSSGGTTGLPSTAADGGAVPAASSSGGGKCGGTPKNGYDMADLQSCQSQGGNWSTTYDECSGGAQSKTCTMKLDKVGCLDLDGCSWTEGGVETRAEWAGGTCSGTEIACSTFDEAGCRANLMWCRMDGSTCKEITFRPFGSSCAELDSSAKGAYHHARIVRDACATRPGCTWTNGDGTTYDK